MTVKRYEAKMYAMQLIRPGSQLESVDIPIPKPNKKEILIKVTACGICRTDLHVVDGELKNPQLPLIPGHQIVGRITELGQEVHNLKLGMRIGVPWLGSSILFFDTRRLCGHPGSTAIMCWTHWISSL